MRRLFKCALALVMVALGISLAQADERPVLRSQVMTLSDIVTIGDFYTNSGLLSQKPLFRSPDMGTSGNVPAELVAERARAAGLETAGTDGLRTVVVYRGATKLNRDQLAGLVRNAISERNAGLDPEKLEVRLLQAPDQVLADPKVHDPVRVDRVEWSAGNGHFTLHASVAVEFGTEQLILSGIATEMIEIAALLQPVRRGDIVKEEDIDMLRLPRNRVPAGAVGDASQIVGKQARTNIRANAPLAQRDFRRPVLIERGEKVTVTFEMPGMKLTSRAQAMDDGAKGDVIDVMNLQSRRVVPAIVTSRGQVRVHAANPVIASLNSETN